MSHIQRQTNIHTYRHEEIQTRDKRKLRYVPLSYGSGHITKKGNMKD